MATGLDAQNQIFNTNPDDRRAFEALEEHYFLEGAWESLVELYRARIEAPSIVEDLDQRGPVLFRLGQILEERLLDIEAAIETYWTLARLDPTNRPALRQLRGIHERKAQWDMVLQIAELESATTMPPYERAAFEAELGRTWQLHLGDPEESRRAYERALEADPDFPAALEGLAALHEADEEYAEAARLLDRLTNRLRGPERAPTWIRLGVLNAGPLANRDRARACFAAALEDDPFQAPAVEWSLLLATEAEDWPVVSELLESRFDLASGARARAAIAVEASQIQLNHLGSTASARAWIDRAIELGSDDPAVLLASSDVEREDGDKEALLASLDNLIVVAGRHIPREALVEAAELHADFGHPDRALEAVRSAVERTGGADERILLLQARLLRDGGSKRELAEVLETLTELDGGQSEANRPLQLRELAQLQEEDLGEEEAALLSWRRAFDLDATSAPALEALERLYPKRDDWASLRNAFEAALEATSDEPSADLNARLGTLLLDHFDEPDRAREHFEAAMGIDADCTAALEGLRQLADKSGDPDLLLAVCEREAEGCHDAMQMAELVDTVVPILEERGAYEEALAWATRYTERARDSVAAFTLRAGYEARLERTEAEIESRRALARLQSGPERGDTLIRLAELHATAGQNSEEAATLELAFEALPERVETLQALCRSYRALDRPQDLVRTLRLLVDAVPEYEQADALEELAATLEDPLGDLDTAIVVRWRLVESPEAPAEAPLKLEALLELGGRYAELAHLLSTRRQQLGDDTDEALELDMRRASILLDSLGHCEEAARIFASLHERHPESDEILDCLERALRGGDDAEALCELLGRRAEWAANDETRAAIQLERARLCEEALADPERACGLYESILENQPDAPAADEADQRLEALLESTGQWEWLCERLEARAARLPEGQQAGLRESIATIYRDRLHDVASCVEQLELVANLVSDRAPIWRQLEELYARELDRPADWLRVVEAELETGCEAEREYTLRVGAARLCLDEERRPDGHAAEEAYSHYERVLELEPCHPEAAEVLALHYANTGRTDETVRILERRIDHLDDQTTADAIDLRLRLAELLGGELEDDEQARTHYEFALEHMGPEARVAEPLADILDREADHAALANLARQVLDLDENRSDELVWRMRLGKSERALGHLEEAAAAYRAARIASPDDREIEDALIEIYQQRQEAEPLLELLEKRLPYAREDEMIDLRLQLAELQATGRGDHDRALRHLEKILEAHPQHRDAFDRAVELARELDDPERLVSLLDRALDAPLPTHERADLLEQRAELMAGPLDSPEQAVLNYREALSHDRGRATAQAGLRNQLERLERWPALLDCLFVAAMEAPEEERFELFEEAAEIAWSRVNPDASLPWLARMRALAPEDPEIHARVSEVHRRAGRFEAALGALDEQLALATEDASRLDLHLQRARLLERELHAPGRAIHAFRNALEIADGSTESEDILVELDRLLDLMGRPTERAEILARRVELAEEQAESDEAASEPTSKVFDLRRTLAALYSVDLAKPALAIPYLEANAVAAARDDLDEMAALGALDAVLRAAGRHDLWVGVAERELALIEANPAVAEATPRDFRRFLREELARTWDELMGDADRSLQHLRVLCRDPDTATGPLGERLRGLLRRTGRRSELAQELTRLLGRGVGTAEEWLELAQLREEVLLDLAGARNAYQEAETSSELQLDAIRGRRRTSERLRDWDGVATALEAEFQLADQLSKSERGALARQLGDLCSERIGSRERAAAGYELALEIDANDLDALRSLIRVKEVGAQAGDVVALYRKELAILADLPDSSAREREVWIQIAARCESKEGAQAEAIDAYCEAGEIDRLNPADELKLARLYQHESCSDAAAFCETFGRWCDREDSPATVEDHLELARVLVDRGESELAAARSERATAIDPECSQAWAMRATLASDAGRASDAAEAFTRAADHAPSHIGAVYCVAAARCLEASDLEASQALLTRAIELDASQLAAHVAATRVADGLGRTDETWREAERALEIARAENLEDEDRLATAVLGGRAARALEDRDASRRLFEIALEVDPSHAEALEGVAYAHFEDGDDRAARPLLERRIELPGDNDDRPKQLAIIARGLESEEHLDAAWTRFEEAIAGDTTLEIAHEGLVRVHERTGRIDEALTALERWSEASKDPAIRAAAAYRAAEHALGLERVDTAITHLEFATESDPELTPAWLMLCEIAAQRAPDEEQRALCQRALESVEPSPLSAQISLRSARLAEVAGDVDEARERYSEAARWDPRASEAALCESRLARMAGDWIEADAILARFLANHPDPDSPPLAHVHLERGRLLSGPLEDFDAAVTAYETALRLGPDLGVARTSLASLLVHSPERWREALALHREILASAPTTPKSLRAIGELAASQNRPELADAAHALLGALGSASPEEASLTAPALRFPIHPGPPMADGDSERLRRIAHQLNEELGELLSASARPLPETGDAEVDQAIEQITGIEDEIAAPGLAGLEPDDRAELFASLAGLFLDPGGNTGDSRFAASLESSIGRWTRRKVRRVVEETTIEAIAEIDQAAWGHELRAMAAAQVIDRSGGALEPVLRALVVLDQDEDTMPAYERASIATLCASCESARRLLERITTQICERLEDGR